MSVFRLVEENQQGSIEELYRSFGAVLAGGLVALFLSGAVFMQVVLYWLNYPLDPIQRKALVVVIWVLDLVHSSMICTANWQNLMVNFGRLDELDYITWSIAVTVALTATTTFMVHCFFSHRVHTLSRGNWYITGPLVALAFVRLVAATVSTGEMIRLHSFAEFVHRYGYVFTLGLGTSTALDVLITGIMCYFLRRRRSGLVKMDHVINVLTIYTIETGMFTCFTTGLSLICWLTMSDNLIFLGLHLIISKLYANSLMASLNARRSITTRSEGSGHGEGYPMPLVFFPNSLSPRTRSTPWSPQQSSHPGKALEVNIDVEQTIHREGFARSQEAVGVQNSGNAPDHESESEMSNDLKAAHQTL